MVGYVKGQVVMKCLPFSYVISNENISNVCDFCLEENQKSTAMKKVGVKSQLYNNQQISDLVANMTIL